MISCCARGGPCAGTNTFFTRWSRWYAQRFRKGGLEPVQKQLLEGISKEPVPAATLLDIGCGVGSLHLTLLKEGAARSFGVDISEGMLREAKRFAQDFGLLERTEYLAGDFTQIAGTIPPCDITMLDKVVCCYEDVETLIASSTARTKRVLALSHPRDNVLMKSLFLGHRLLARVFGWSFHPFWHDWNALQSQILARGFEMLYDNSTISWHVLVFRRI